MSSEKITKLAIKRHDLDASYFQNTYAKSSSNGVNKREAVFLNGRKLVLDELQSILDTLPKGSRILDVGCGTAHLINWIKEKGFEVYGIEPSVEMFNYARANFPDIEIKQAISSEIPYPDNYFNLIVAFEVLRYLDKSENSKTYKEFYRALKKEGKFFVTQVNLFSTDFYYFFHNVKALISKITGTHHHCNFSTSFKQESIVKKAGFKEVSTVGRFIGSTRIFYKFGGMIGDFYTSLMQRLYNRQRFTSFHKNLSGHLIVMVEK